MFSQRERICITIAILTHHKGGFSSSRLGKECKHSLLSFRSVGSSRGTYLDQLFASWSFMLNPYGYSPPYQGGLWLKEAALPPIKPIFLPNHPLTKEGFFMGTKNRTREDVCGEIGVLPTLAANLCSVKYCTIIYYTDFIY